MITDGSGNLSFSTISGGGGSSLTVQDEGSALSTAATTLNFVGNGVVASGTGATKTITVTDTNTTYSVGDGGLTQNNFTNTLKSKLDGVAASATANPNALDNLSEDNTPSLGGNLDVNGHDIVSTSNAAIELDPNGSGKVTFKGNSTRGAGQFVLNCEQNSHGVTIKGPPHSANADYTLTLPNSDGTADQVLKTDGSGNLDWVAQSGGSGISNLVEDSTPSLGGDLDTNSNAIKFGDRSSSGVNELIFGAGDDLKIFHGTNNHSQIVEGGSGNLQIYASNLQLKAEAGHDYLVATSGGSVELYHNSNKKAETTSTGINVTGKVSVNAIAPVSGNLSVSDMTYNEVQYASLGTTGTLTPDPANGSIQKITLTGNITINALGGTPAAGDSVTVIIVQPSSGNYTLTSTMKFAGGTKTLSTTSNYIDVLTIYYDGTNYLADLATNFS